MKKDNRFIISYVNNNDFSTKTMILVDKYTGVNYLFAKQGECGGLSVMLDANGNPIVTPSDQLPQ